MQNNQKKGKTNSAGDPSGATSIMERRRLGRVVHDERGNARVEWVKAQSDDERVRLSLEDSERMPGYGYNPYEKDADRLGGDPSERSKRDLRRLSDWIKQMRELEARKQRGDDAEDD